MKFNYICKILLVYTHFYKIYSVGDEVTYKVKVRYIYFDETKNDFNKDLDFKIEKSVYNSFNYNTSLFFTEITNRNNALKNDIDNDYYLYKIENTKDENNVDIYYYNPEVVNLTNGSIIDLYFKKKHDCTLNIIVDNTTFNITNLKFRNEFNYEYLKNEIKNAKKTNKIKNFTYNLDDDLYFKCLKIDDEEFNSEFKESYKLEQDNSVIDLTLKKFYKSDLSVIINNNKINLKPVNLKENDLLNNYNFENFLHLTIYNEKNKFNNDVIKDYCENYKNYILYNIFKENEEDTSESYKKINYDDIKQYLNNDNKHNLTVMIKNTINIIIKFEDYDKLIFEKDKIDSIINNKNWKCKTIKDLKDEIIKMLNIKIDNPISKIYKIEGSEEKFCNDDDYLLYNNTYII